MVSGYDKNKVIQIYESPRFYGQAVSFKFDEGGTEYRNELV